MTSNTVTEAQSLGAVIYSGESLIERKRWYWSHGTHCRSSNDHYGLSFATAAEAASHFLQSREGRHAQAMRARLPQAHRVST